MYQDHVLSISITNDTYIPILPEVVGIAFGEIDQLLAGITASSWLHGYKNLSAQMMDPLLSSG